MGFKKDLRVFIKKQAWLTKLYRNHRDGFLFEKSYIRKIKGKGNSLKINRSARFVDCEINITGNGNEIMIGEDSFFKNVKFFIDGNFNTITISENIKFNRGGSLWVEDENCSIKIGANTSFEDVHIAVTESNSTVHIGHDCMFANEIDIRTGDSHAIFDNLTKSRINHAQNVEIGDHVWVGAHVSILKGVQIKSNSIVATRSVVTKKFEAENILLAGIPAVPIRENISWSRERIPKTSE